MEDLRISKDALERFLQLSPSERDKSLVKEELSRLKSDPDAGEPVPFNQWHDCYFTYCEDWIIIYQRTNPRGIFVVDFSRR